MLAATKNSLCNANSEIQAICGLVVEASETYVASSPQSLSNKGKSSNICFLRTSSTRIQLFFKLSNQGVFVLI